jgi:hypothetical protein
VANETVSAVLARANEVASGGGEVSTGACVGG